MIGIGCAHFDTARYEQAVLWKRKAPQEQPGTAWINRTLSVSYARLGERMAALVAIAALRLAAISRYASWATAVTILSTR